MRQGSIARFIASSSLANLNPAAGSSLFTSYVIIGNLLGSQSMPLQWANCGQNKLTKSPSSLLLKFVAPKNFSKVKGVKKMANVPKQQFVKERSGIVEYLEDISKTDEHYFRIYENYDCWGLENVGAAIASYLPPLGAGSLKAMEYWQGLDRDWNAIETKCIGLGDPYCEFKLVPGEIDDLRDSLEKDSSVIERIHERLMERLMGFLLHGEPLVERPRLGNNVNLHVVQHAMGGEGIHAMGTTWSQRYRMALRMGGAKSGKEVGERLTNAGLSSGEARSAFVRAL